MKKQIKNKGLLVSIVVNVLLVVILVIACFGDRLGSGKYAKSADHGAYYGYDESAAAWYDEDVAEAEEGYEYNGRSEAKAADPEEAGVDVDEEAVKNGEKLVYTANISIESKEYQAHKARIFEVIKANGVVVENMSEDSYDSRFHGYFTLRVPYDKFEVVYQALCSSEEGWTVRSASSRVENMTKQYSKLTAQIEAFEQERETLLELLKQAENVTETLEIQDRLAWLNSDLQYYYNQREEIDSDVLMSTIYLEMQEIQVRQQSVQPYTFSERIQMAYQDGKDAFLEFCEDFALFFVGNWLFLGSIVIIVVIIIVLHKAGKKRRMKKAAKVEKEETEAAPEETQE